MEKGWRNGLGSKKRDSSLHLHPLLRLTYYHALMGHLGLDQIATGSHQWMVILAIILKAVAGIAQAVAIRVITLIVRPVVSQ
mgnify:CR=1 FL=1